jgi:hypothetical protein
LTDGSPSCGTTYAYDGTFSGGSVEGRGVTARLLADQGLRVFPEDQIDEADRYLRSLEEQAGQGLASEMKGRSRSRSSQSSPQP